ncbi:MAG TPA: hypothetical protein VF041_05830 [Gemmatimonadaceae bacterium]
MKRVDGHVRASPRAGSRRRSASIGFGRAACGAGTVLLLSALLTVPLAARTRQRAPITAIVIAPDVRDSMNAIWSRSNQHWNELAEVNTLTQMLGSGRPTQREYLGCLIGRFDGDTLRVTGTRPARGMRQLQFAVSGSCDAVPGYVGTWHTHPFRADTAGNAVKERGLSAQDLDTFLRGHDAAVLVVWDVDSLDAAARDGVGAVQHPTSVQLE